MTAVGAPLAIRRTSLPWSDERELDKLRGEVVREHKQAERQQRRAARRLRWRRRARLAAIPAVLAAVAGTVLWQSLAGHLCTGTTGQHAGHWLTARSTHAPLSGEF
jgi:hypothetical protein